MKAALKHHNLEQHRTILCMQVAKFPCQYCVHFTPVSVGSAWQFQILPQKTWNFTLKRPLCWTTFLLNIVRLWSWNLYTVELRWLEFEGTVKICSSYRKFEPLRSCNFREKIIRFWPRTVSLRYYNWCTVKWAFLVKNM